MRINIAALLVAQLTIGCSGGAPGDGDDGAPSGPDLDRSSFATLQREVFTPTCATSGCHSGASPQGQLALTADASYDQLVGVAPANPAARTDGLMRVTPGRPDASLLFHKLIVPAGHHASDYGNPMPQGTAGLSVGALEYVRQWIAKGAPRSGAVADASLLRDATRQVTLPFEPLPAPSAGTGFQLRVEPFDVSTTYERELFTYRALANTQPVYVNRIETSMRPYSHHFVLYTFEPTTPANVVPPPNVVRDIRSPNGSLIPGNMEAMGFHVFLAGAMAQRMTFTFPAGTALRLPANAGIDLNVHYANHTSGTVQGEAYANLYTVPVEQVQQVVTTLDLAHTAIRLPPRTRTTVERAFTFDAPASIYALTSHTHARGVRFQIRIVGGVRDGELVYENLDWEHPAIVTYPQPIALAAGEGLRSIVTYDNTTGREITFGLTSEDEMDIIFGYVVR